MNNGTSKDQAVVSKKKKRVFPSQSRISWIAINFDPLKFLQGPYFFRQEDPSKILVRTLHYDQKLSLEPPTFSSYNILIKRVAH